MHRWKSSCIWTFTYANTFIFSVRDVFGVSSLHIHTDKVNFSWYTLLFATTCHNYGPKTLNGKNGKPTKYRETERVLNALFSTVMQKRLNPNPSFNLASSLPENVFLDHIYIRPDVRYRSFQLP